MHSLVGAPRQTAAETMYDDPAGAGKNSLLFDCKLGLTISIALRSESEFDRKNYKSTVNSCI
jgi:hypothetical protein